MTIPADFGSQVVLVATAGSVAFVGAVIRWQVKALQRKENACALYRYVGFDYERSKVTGVHPQLSRLREGMQWELERLIIEAGGIAHELSDYTHVMFEFFLDVPVSLSWFFDQSLLGEVDPALRVRVTRIVSQAQACFADVTDNPKVTDEFLGRTDYWLRDLNRWIAVVEEFGPETVDPPKLGR